MANNTIINKNKNIQLFFFLIFIIFNILTTYNCILIRKSPYLKKLNNNRYILISNKGITFLDPTLTIESNSIIFEKDAYTDPEGELTDEMFLIYSTTAVQFSEEDNNLILSIVNADLYIFDSNEILLKKQTIIEDYDSYGAKKPYYLFPYKRNGSIYETIFFAVTDYLEDFIFLTLQFLIYDKDSNEISLTEKVIYNLNPQVELDLMMFENSIGCNLMKNNNQEIINCIY